MKGKEWKKAIALFLAFTMLVTSAPANFYASVDTAKAEMEQETDTVLEAEADTKNANSATSGTLGSNNGFQWTYDASTKTATITGQDEDIDLELGGLPMDKVEHYIFKNCTFSGSLKGLFQFAYKGDYGDTKYGNPVVKSIKFTNCNTKDVVDMSDMFSGCESLENLDISCFNTAKVKDMSGMFRDCYELTSIDVKGFNTSQVTDMSAMFFGCRVTSLDVRSFDTSKVTDMSDMFHGCPMTSLDLSGFNTSQVTDMSYMFNHCMNLTSLNLSRFNTAKVKNMSDMFAYCTSLKSLNMKGFNTSQVTNMSEMFAGCGHLTSLDVSHFNTSKVTDMTDMFMLCGHLTSLDVSHFNTSKVTDMWGMFYACRSLTSLDVSKFDTLNVTCMANMFGGCESLKSINVSKFNTSNVTNMGAMFWGCKRLESLDLSNFDTSKVKSEPGIWSSLNGFVEECTNLQILHTPKKMLSTQSFTLPHEFKTPKGKIISECTADHCGTKLTRYEENKSYTITYELNGGKNNSSNPTTYDKNTATITLKNPTRTGYTFAGWYSDAGYKTKVTEIKQGSTGNKTFYAKWTAHKYNIAFKGNGATSGTMSTLKSRTYGKSYTLTKNAFKKKNYTFAGWNTKADGSGKTYKNEASIKNLSSKNGATVTLYAQWKKPKYSITYKLDGGTNHKDNPTSYYSTSATKELKKPTKKGYTFKGWYSDSKYKTKVTEIKKGSKGNKTLYAKWVANKYTIKFDGIGATKGSMSPMKNKSYGKSYKLSALKFERKGYEFTGWNTKEDGSGKTYKNKESVKNLSSKDGATVTLYAQWKKVKYTISYELKGGTNHKDNPTSFHITSATKKLQKPTRKGYAFKGWYSDSKYTTKVTQIKKGSTGNKTFYAKWDANEYDIVFKGNGATSGKMSKLKDRVYGKSYTLTSNAYKRKGYTFTGWNTKADGSGKTYANKASVKNLSAENGAKVTLYAQWEKTKYTITYKLDGGANHKDNPTYYYITSSTKTLKNPTKAGYTFKGWYSDSTFKTKVTEIPKGSSGNIKLYAKWSENKYNIVFNGNGATGGAMSKISGRVYGQSYTLPENLFVKADYEFAGWNTNPDGKGIAYADKALVKNLVATNGGTITLYAQWERFTPRKAAPAFTDKYYNLSDNRFGTCNGAGNCTWYAYGRAYEILGVKPGFAGNAKEWWKYRENFKGYSTDVNQPKEGALIVWGNQNYSGAGHVAIIEEILEDGRIVYSESSYGGLWYYSKPAKYLNTYNWYGNAVRYWGTAAMTPTQILNVEDANNQVMGFVGYIYLE